MALTSRGLAFAADSHAAALEGILSLDQEVERTRRFAATDVKMTKRNKKKKETFSTRKPRLTLEGTSVAGNKELD